MTEKLSKQFLQEINDEFQMVLLEEPSVCESNSDGVTIENPFEFKPLATSTPKRKKNHLTEPLAQQNRKPSSRLTMSQFVGRPHYNPNNSEKPEQTVVKLRNFMSESPKDFETFIVERVQDDFEMFNPIEKEEKHIEGESLTKAPVKKVASFRRFPQRDKRRRRRDVFRNLDVLFQEHANKHDETISVHDSTRVMMHQIFERPPLEDSFASFKISDRNKDSESKSSDLSLWWDMSLDEIRSTNRVEVNESPKQQYLNFFSMRR